MDTASQGEGGGDASPTFKKKKKPCRSVTVMISWASYVGGRAEIHVKKKACKKPDHVESCNFSSFTS